MEDYYKHLRGFRKLRNKQYKPKSGIHREICIIYSLGKNPKHYMLHWYDWFVTSGRNIGTIQKLKEECAVAFSMEVQDMVMMWSGRIIHDENDFSSIILNDMRKCSPFGYPSFVVYDRCMIEFATNNDKVGFQSYFQSINLSVTFRYASGDSDGSGFDHLQVAATCGNGPIVQALLDYSEDWNSNSLLICSPTLFAAAVNNVDAMIVFLDNGAPLDGSLLLCACSFGHCEVAEILIRRGVCVNSVDPSSYRTALHLSCYYGDIKMTKMLIRKGSLINTVIGNSDEPTTLGVFKNGYYPIHFAILRKIIPFDIRMELVSSLLNSGASSNVCDYYGRPLLLSVVSLHDSRGDFYGGFDAYPQHVSIRYRQILDMVRLMCSYGCNINSFDIHGRSAIHMVVKFFPDPDLTATTTIRPSESYTRFEEAVNFGICEIIKYLVEQGIDVGQNDSLGRNAYDQCLLENDVLLNLKPVLDLLHDILSFRSFSFKRQQPIDNLEADIGDVEEEEIDV